MTYFYRTACNYRLALGTLNHAFSFGLLPGGKMCKAALSIRHLHPTLRSFLLLRLDAYRLYQLQSSHTSVTRRAVPHICRFA